MRIPLVNPLSYGITDFVAKSYDCQGKIFPGTICFGINFVGTICPNIICLGSMVSFLGYHLSMYVLFVRVKFFLYHLSSYNLSWTIYPHIIYLDIICLETICPGTICLKECFLVRASTGLNMWSCASACPPVCLLPVPVSFLRGFSEKNIYHFLGVS